MHRVLLPFPLAIIGFLMMLYAIETPLFQWQVSESSSELSAAYSVHFASSPWFAQLGDSLDDPAFVFRWVFVSKEKKYCSSEGLDVAVKRSKEDKLLEKFSLFLNVNEKTAPWLLGWGLIQIILSGLYMWWFTFWHDKRLISEAIPYTVFFTLVLCLFLMPAMKLIGPDLSFATLDDCQGTIIFSASLLKVSYSVPILLFTGLAAELGALNLMVRQIRSMRKRNESEIMAVG